MGRKKKDDATGIRQKFSGDYLVYFVDEVGDDVYLPGVTFDELVKLYKEKDLKITKVEFLSRPYFRPVDVTKEVSEKIAGAK